MRRFAAPIFLFALVLPACRSQDKGLDTGSVTRDTGDPQNNGDPDTGEARDTGDPDGTGDTDTGGSDTGGPDTGGGDTGGADTAETGLAVLEGEVWLADHIEPWSEAPWPVGVHFFEESDWDPDSGPAGTAAVMLDLTTSDFPLAFSMEQPEGTQGYILAFIDEDRDGTENGPGHEEPMGHSDLLVFPSSGVEVWIDEVHAHE